MDSKNGKDKILKHLQQFFLLIITKYSQNIKTEKSSKTNNTFNLLTHILHF